MSAGLRIYDPVTHKVTLEITDRISRIVGTIYGNGSLSVPSTVKSVMYYIAANTTEAVNAFAIASTVVTVTPTQVTVTNAPSWAVTYVGGY